MDMIPGKGGKTTAVIRIGGTLMKSASSLGGTSTVQLRRDVRNAATDPNVSAILLAIDSPGGAVAGTADLAADVKAATRKKPVWAHVDDLGASAAYWIASQANAIYANSPTALIGSIGTVMTIYDQSQAAEQAGVKTLVFRTGPLKGAGTPGEPITEDQTGHFQKLVNEVQTHFDHAVRSGRGMSAAQLAAVRSGGVFPADEAKSLGLIDGVRSLDSTLAALSAAK
jgi:signal peptide peptidase SppA